MLIDTTTYIYPRDIYRYFSSNGDFLTLFTEWFVESAQYGNADVAILHDHACAVLGIESAEDQADESIDATVVALSAMMHEFGHRNKPLTTQLLEVARIKLSRGQPGDDGESPIPEALIVSSVDHMSQGGRYVTIN